MAPPRVTKKSTTSEQTVRRNGHREHRVKHVVEEEEDEMTDENGSGHEEAAARTDSQGSEMHLGNLNLEEVLDDMLIAQSKRREFRRNAVLKSFNKTVSETQEGITTLFDNHEAQSSKAHNAQISHLRQLLAEKADIENQIEVKVSKLRREYLAHSEDLQRVAELRARKLV
ncbi:hypothetical protein K469DRAFT_632881 [Zopfia rhizophila CBS 207.26]|uniref:Uncharacterized protein n=1 Tax=Zopfia rhizophila CBS 207.26 TaxID=1314779 RepID=A0A6A6E265_9PEZI|nr:hypothetical protein K469DRAFT_632881 [Zopfia rhizophila CBS 207.26]